MKFAQFVLHELEHRTFFLLSNNCLPKEVEPAADDLFPLKTKESYCQSSSQPIISCRFT